MKSGVKLIAEERARQVAAEGWTSKHDDTHTDGQLARAAGAYIDAAKGQILGVDIKTPQSVNALIAAWPWDDQWWKPSDDPIRNLVKAGALIAAEIDRLQRKGKQ